MKDFINHVLSYWHKTPEEESMAPLRTPEVKPLLTVKAVFDPTENYSHRAPNQAIDAIVIHHTGTNHYNSALNWMKTTHTPTGERNYASAHFYVGVDGSLVQLVALEHKAWHAGVSELHGRKNVNDFSVGFELQGDGNTPFSEIQYEVTAKAIVALQARFPRIEVPRIVGHYHISPGRKSDPTPFDWEKLFNLINTFKTAYIVAGDFV